MGALLDFVAVDTDSEILGHVAALDGVNDCLLEGVREVLEKLVVVKLCAMGETTSPGED